MILLCVFFFRLIFFFNKLNEIIKVMPVEGTVDVADTANLDHITKSEEAAAEAVEPVAETTEPVVAQ